MTEVEYFSLPFISGSVLWGLQESVAGSSGLLHCPLTDALLVATHTHVQTLYTHRAVHTHTNYLVKLSN